MLGFIKSQPYIYDTLAQNGDYFFTELQNIVQRAGLPYPVCHTGSLGCLFFTGQKVTDYESAKTSDIQAYASYCRYMLSHGIYLAPAQFEAMFLSAAHTREQLDETLEIAESYFKNGQMI